jgi:two-component system, OmpR family, sensor histidine kinase VicK
MVRLDRLGVIDYAIKASQQNAAEVKVICPLSQVNFEIVKRISDKAPNIKILNGNNCPHGMFIVDSQKFFRAELREPNAEQLSEAIGFTVYSNSKVSVSSFRSVFELLWNEHMLNEDLKRADEMQKEFINIAAHELRTPAQSILGFAELATTDPKYSQQQKQELFIDVIYRNAVRLHRLTKDILDVTRIESHTLYLNKELLNLNNVIANVLFDVQTQTMAIAKDKVSVIYKLAKGDTTANSDTIFIEADRERITQVLHNLLDNAVKFSKEGDIVSVTVEDKNQEDTNNKEKGLQQGEVMVKVKDTGTGIHPEILPRLFSKFATKSLTGTGLGLYISKSIVEAHGGRIWAENNTKGRGATFYFTLPLAK